MRQTLLSFMETWLELHSYKMFVHLTFCEYWKIFEWTTSKNLQCCVKSIRTVLVIRLLNIWSSDESLHLVHWVISGVTWMPLQEIYTPDQSHDCVGFSSTSVNSSDWNHHFFRGPWHPDLGLGQCILTRRDSSHQWIKGKFLGYRSGTGGTSAVHIKETYPMTSTRPWDTSSSTNLLAASVGPCPVGSTTGVNILFLFPQHQETRKKRQILF